MLLLALALSLATPAHQPPTCTLPDGFRVNLELALTEEERATGLMFRDHLEPDWGMIFLFNQEGFWPFWMKNTLIPLDMLWLDRDGVVVEVMSPVEPCRLDPCPSYTPKAAGRGVLELGAGVAAKHGVKVGSRLVFTGVPEYPVAAPQSAPAAPKKK
jgi:uncharacterized protein